MCFFDETMQFRQFNNGLGQALPQIVIATGVVIYFCK